MDYSPPLCALCEAFNDPRLEKQSIIGFNVLCVLRQVELSNALVRLLCSLIENRRKLLCAIGVK